MALPYSIPSINDTSNIMTIFQFVNNEGTGGLFMPIMLLVIWIVAFVGTISEGRQASRGMIFASFICSILAVLLSLMQMLNPNYMYFCFLLLGGGIIWHYLNNSPGI